MSDKTISFKVEDELSEKAKNLIEASGLTAKEWFQKAVQMAEMQSLKDGATDYASDLGELEVHTTRIYELVSNMVQRSIYLKDNAVKDLEMKLEQQREITADFQTRIKDTQDQRDQALANLDTSKKEQEDLTKQVDELRGTLETNKLLVNEYKDKNDTLTGLVTKYESYATENEQLKQTLTAEQASYQTRIDQLTRQSEKQVSTINDLEQQTNRLKEAHEIALERLRERLEVEQQKALLQTERDHQKALAEINNTYNEKLNTLYEDRDKQRQAYEQKIENLQQQLNVERTKNNKSK